MHTYIHKYIYINTYIYTHIYINKYIYMHLFRRVLFWTCNKLSLSSKCKMLSRVSQSNTKSNMFSKHMLVNHVRSCRVQRKRKHTSNTAQNSSFRFNHKKTVTLPKFNFQHSTAEDHQWKRLTKLMRRSI